MAPTTTRRIAILSDAVANQIAAGEVVERPASVVKELVENAIDAGARHVRVEIEQGGKTLLLVSDDGSGMSRDDAVLALDRHATSKIVSAADLVGVRTFGFRGEALPAIASVSRFTLSTSDGGDATDITVTGGRLDGVAPAVRQRGTTVTVRALFFNTPARRKFLRSVPSETRAASEALATLALAHAAVGFELVVDGDTRLQVPPDQDDAARLAGVWGPHLAGTLIPVAYASGPLRVVGFAQRPGDAAPTGRRAQLFVNGRPFRDSFLVRAGEAGYRSAIHPGDRPSMLLRLEVDPAEVDVNVHPAKLEVRFRDRIAIERVVEEAIRHALGGLEAAAPVGEWRPMPSGGRGELAFLGFAEGAENAGNAEDGEDPEKRGADGRIGGQFSAPVSQLFNTYIVFEGPEALVMVDQHSAHERVLFEEVMAQLSGSGAASQRLLLPETVELTDEELDALERHRETIESVGFQVEPFGGRSVVLHAVPAPHRRFDAIACFRELMADLARGRFGGWANRLERFAATYACRAAIKGGMPLSEEEMRALLFRLFETRLAAHDVHGRSTIVQLPREELERRLDDASLPVLVGPTAIGKTAVAMALAAHLPIEVISADSRQVYRRLDVGTAKPTRRERLRVPHHGVDVADPGERYSAGRYAREAAGWIGEVRARGRLPVIVGGTGLYVRALVDGLFVEPPLDPERRRELEHWVGGLAAGDLVRWAARLDPGFAGGGRQRATRSIEIALLTGHPLSEWHHRARGEGTVAPWYVRLTAPRPVLHQRIKVRAEDMVRRGLIEEVAAVLSEGHAGDAHGLDGVGLREAVQYLHGKRTRDTVADAVATSTRQYAKRQETWFRHQIRGPVLTLDATRPPEALASEIASAWANR